MRPAFRSSRSAVAFALLVAATLVAPAVVARTGWLERRGVYNSIPLKYGPFPFAGQQIFDRTDDADIVFMGSSRVFTSIYTPYVKRQLTAKLGREANVFTLGWPWPGFDADYVVARDLFSHRRVKMLVISNEDLGPDGAHLHAARWFRWGENNEAIDDLPASAKAQYYASTVLGMPRHVLGAARENIVEDPLRCRENFWNSYYHAPNVAENDGSLRARLGFGNRYAVFEVFRPHGAATPADARVYSGATKDSFEFAGHLQPVQLHFARKLAQLCQEHGTRLVVMHVPVYSEREKNTIREVEMWPEALGAPLDLVGIPPAKLFAGIAQDDVQKLFYEDAHLNQNGQDFFTPLITPTLLDLYAKPTVENR